MMISVAQMIAGMLILLVGGELMVRGASSLARSLGVSPLAVGLTVVAFGTSAPELAVSVGAALNGSGTLAFGNIYGSNLANIGLIIGLAALLHPLPIDTAVIRRELPMMLLAIAAASAMAADAFLGEGIARFSRSDGLILLLFFFVFVYYTLGDLVAQRSEASRPEEDRSDTVDIHTAPGTDSNFATSSDKPQDAPARRPRRDAFMIVVGIGGLLLGAQWTVDGGITVARAVGIPEVIVGLTMISIGTSLPELVATGALCRLNALFVEVHSNSARLMLYRAKHHALNETRFKRPCPVRFGDIAVIGEPDA